MQNAKRIENVAIVGMGALGILFGQHLTQAIGSDRVTFIADAQRVERYKNSTILSNDTVCQFAFSTPEAYGRKPDLLIFAVKGTALKEALFMVRPLIGHDTIIISLINGIESETYIEDMTDHDAVVVSCVAQGMDALRTNTSIRYTKMGYLCIGLKKDQTHWSEAFRRLTDFFDAVRLPYRAEEDIERRLWCKWMQNIGVNQIVLLEQSNFACIQQPGPARERMIAAMREVMQLAAFNGIVITEDDLNEYLAINDSLNPAGMPSMRQDGVAKRYSEVELFSGALVRKAAAVGMQAPVNEQIYRDVKAIDATY